MRRREKKKMKKMRRRTRSRMKKTKTKRKTRSKMKKTKRRMARTRMARTIETSLNLQLGGFNRCGRRLLLLFLIILKFNPST